MVRDWNDGPFVGTFLDFSRIIDFVKDREPLVVVGFKSSHDLKRYEAMVELWKNARFIEELFCGYDMLFRFKESPIAVRGGLKADIEILGTVSSFAWREETNRYWVDDEEI